MPKERRFVRYATEHGPTRAFNVFKKHQTEISDMYWSFRCAGSYAEYLARKTVKPESDPAQLFHATGPDARRLPSTVGDWRKHFAEFSNWVRLAAVMSMSAYLESYLRNVMTLAIRSDPLIRFGSPRLQDGTVWLKRSVADDVEPLLKDCLVGSWHRRARYYEKLFGSVPCQISDSLAELEALRRTRNSVGHEFGRHASQNHHGFASDLAKVRVSEKRLVKWLALVETVAKAVDAHLYQTFIGEFESILFYHSWSRRPRTGRDASLTETRALQKALGKAYGSPPSQHFCKGLIEFYKAC